MNRVAVFLLLMSASASLAQEVPDSSTVARPANYAIFAIGAGFGAGDVGDDLGTFGHLSFRLGVLLRGRVALSSAFRPTFPIEGEPDGEPISYERVVVEAAYFVGPQESSLRQLLLAGGVESNERGIQPYVSAAYTLGGVPIVGGFSIRGAAGPDIARIELVLELIPLTALPLPF